MSFFKQLGSEGFNLLNNTIMKPHIKWLSLFYPRNTLPAHPPSLFSLKALQAPIQILSTL